jgi:hypothetical protein
MDPRPDSVFDRWLRADGTLLVDSPASTDSSRDEDEVEELAEEGDVKSVVGSWEWVSSSLAATSRSTSLARFQS